MADVRERPEHWPAWAQDSIFCDIDICFTWRDRVRLLWHGQASVRVETCVENAPGRLDSNSRVFVPPILPKREQREEGIGEGWNGD